VSLGNEDDIHIMYDMVSRRYAEQNMPPPISRDYFDSLSKQFYDKNMKVFLARVENTVVSGLVLVYHRHTAHMWIGVPKMTYQGHPVNELIQWEAIKWCCRNGILECELIGANTPRLIAFKMQFSPSLALYFHVKRANLIAKLAEKAYVSLWKGRSSIWEPSHEDVK
jgi:lipid II:glycine glycyltransferase (peptidoglycan interpeptide bridge formation enzyme)